MTNFFGHLFLINFAVGVVTGIVQEFQFGMNWSEFSFFVGNIFGVPLALEVLMAFFLESTFIGLWWFGKDRLKPWMRLASIWIVAIGTQISAFWIVLANAWMHRPVGYEVVNGQAVLISFSEVVFNYKAWLSRCSPPRCGSRWSSRRSAPCSPRRAGTPRRSTRATTSR
jgi:cytochrome d ubiquinol oxidase subunit I